MKRHRLTLLLLSAVLGFGLALAGAASALACARPVEVVTVFAGAFGSGAALVAALREYRDRSAGSVQGERMT